MQRQEQVQGQYDLVAIFNEETKAEAAETKLLKEGFHNDEVFRLANSLFRKAQFREHGPNQNRGSVFLQTTRSGPNPAKVIVFALVFGLILGLVAFLAHFAIATLPVLTATLAGAVVGIVLGAIIGYLQREVRGNIGQDTTKGTPARATGKDDLNVIAIRFSDPENVSRKSRARAIMLNNGGKIDRSIATRE